MSIAPNDRVQHAEDGVAALLARAAAADARADRRLAAAIDDFFLPDEARLDDRLRSALAAALGAMVATLDRALGEHAARLLVVRGAPELATALIGETASLIERLAAAGLMRDAELMRELIGRVRSDVISEALPPQAPDEPDRASLLARLAQSRDGVIAARAHALLAAESRRRATTLVEAPSGSDLPAALHHRLVWWIVAALRERAAPAGGDLAALDRALAEAAVRHIAAHDEDDRLEAAALRLAAAIDAQPDELAPLLVEMMADRRLAMFIAILAHALGLDHGDTREIVLEPEGDQLWTVLRALEVDRASIARIGVSLAEADPRREIELLADRIDAIAALAPDEARTALAPLLLHRDYRAALRALARGGRI